MYVWARHAAPNLLPTRPVCIGIQSCPADKPLLAAPCCAWYMPHNRPRMMAHTHKHSQCGGVLEDAEDTCVELVLAAMLGQPQLGQNLLGICYAEGTDLHLCGCVGVYASHHTTQTPQHTHTAHSIRREEERPKIEKGALQEGGHAAHALCCTTTLGEACCVWHCCGLQCLPSEGTLGVCAEHTAADTCCCHSCSAAPTAEARGRGNSDCGFFSTSVMDIMQAFCAHRQLLVLTPAPGSCAASMHCPPSTTSSVWLH